MVTIALVMIWNVFLSQLELASGADRFKKEDQVEVFFLNSWFPGTVVEVDRKGNALVEFQFANAPKRQVFAEPSIRLVYEVGAMTKSRTWTALTGKFKIQAALLSFDDSQVVLRKPDMSELTVKLEKLSEADQRFVKNLAKSVVSQPSVPSLPPTEQFDESASIATLDESSATKLAEDPLPNNVRMVQGGVVFATDDFFDRLGSVLPVGGADCWLLASLESSKPGGANPTRLLWFSLTKKKLEARQLLPPGESLLDYNAKVRRALTKSDADQGRSSAILTLWDVSPADKVAKPIVRWHNPSKDQLGFADWARILDDGSVLHRRNKQEYCCWDPVRKELRYSLNQQSFFAPVGVLSCGRKHFVLPEDEAIRIFDSQSGKLAARLPVSDGASAVSMSEDGIRLAVLGKSSLMVWELNSLDRPMATYAAESIATPFAGKIAWVGNDHVIATSPNKQLQVLYSLKHKLPLWSYEFDMTAVRENEFDNYRTRELVDSHFVYAASTKPGEISQLAVGAVKLPGPKVLESTSSLNANDYMLVKRGTAVKLEVQAGDYNPAVTAALRGIIDKNGWRISDNAAVTILARMKRGEQQNITYSSGFGPSSQTSSVSLTPYVSELQVLVGKDVAWQSGTQSGAPPVMMLRSGQTAQGEVDKWQRPSPEFFENTNVPENIMDPKFKFGFGTTSITNRGLVPKSSP
jgi:hypothetical protein